MDPNTETRGESSGRSSNESVTGVELKHPPRSIENLSDIDKRFIAGALREGYVQGLETCASGRKPANKRESLRFADQWITQSVPFLAGVIGDADQGSSSGR